MPNYRLVYFGFKGRAEISRLLFAAAGVEYEDIRMTREVFAAEHKKDAPFGQVPLLEVDGEVICQTLAIARYLARKFGLAGKTDMDQAQADMICDCFADLISALLASITYEEDEGRKTANIKKFQDDQLPDGMSRFEKMLVSNNGGDGFLVGSELTWADLCFIDFCTWPKPFAQSDLHLEKYPKLAALRKRVESLPKIANWIANRPKTDL